MTSNELLAVLRSKGCAFIRAGKGSHQLWQCHHCRTTIPMHGGDIPVGTLRAIQKQLEPCLGKNWWKT
jgi:predicted RNA binding protein YcfA (HicA-like mRNA interferase family)